MWKDLNAHPLNAKNLEHLFKNKIPLIRIPNFGTHEEIEELAERFLSMGAKSNSVKTVTRIGISQYQQGVVEGKENYFSLVESAWNDLNEISSTTFNPVNRMLESLSPYAPETSILEEEGFGRYFAGVAKLRTGVTPMHSDFPLFGSEDWAIAQMKAQLSWNFYLRIPESGGELRIWDRFWEAEDDEKYLVKGSYYHNEEVVKDVQSITLKPKAGEVLIINSRNYHTVLPCDHRVAIGSWISLMPDNSLKLWS